MNIGTFVRFLAALPLLLLVGCGGGGGAASEPGVASMEIRDGDGQSTLVSSPLPRPLVVRLLDAGGTPVTGQVVQFAVTSGTGSVSPVTALTDAAGLASTAWTLGPAAGETQRVEARVFDANGEPLTATFSAGALPGLVRRVEIAQGANQEAIQGEALPLPVTFVVRGEGDAPLPGVRVALSTDSGGTVTPSEATTDTQGRVSVQWRLGLPPQGQILQLAIDGVTWSAVQGSALMAPPGVATAITVVSGDAQSLVQHGALAAPLVVRVTDSYGNGVPDVQVVFAPADGMVGFTPASVTTSARPVDGGGYARLPEGWVHASGDLRIEARVAGLPAATFSLLVEPNPHRFDGVYPCLLDGVSWSLEIIVIQGYPTTQPMLDPLRHRDARPAFVGMLDEASGALVAGWRAGEAVMFDITATIGIDGTGVATIAGSYVYHDSNNLLGPTYGHVIECRRS